MTFYPLEFHRRLEQKWARRMGQFFAIPGQATPPRDPDDDEDDDANDVEEDEDEFDQSPVVREPDE
jgi:hypothetical protein